ncbi:MAG: TenA family transcriptional regulator [Burkholderiales bacterium]
MNFFAVLQEHTRSEREHFIAVPIIQGCLRGEVSLPSYIAFLTQAYYHVRHTVPLLQACKTALADPEFSHLHWLLPALDEYIEEERGHDEWILDDLRACGADADAIRIGTPAFSTEVMVAYAYDLIQRVHPLGFFGMVHVLEGTSVALALMAADRIQQGLNLPAQAFRYLRSHGTLDQEHTAHFAQLVNALDRPEEQALLIHAAKNFYRLYGQVFIDLPLPQGQWKEAA